MLYVLAKEATVSAQRRADDSGDDDAHMQISESHDTVVRSSFTVPKTLTSTGGSGGSLSTDESLENAVATVVTMRPKVPPKPKKAVSRRQTAEIVREFEEKVSSKTAFKYWMP